jgi:superfamily II DNA helicase RecQ
VRIVSAVFEKDGRSIPYRKAGLTSDGEALEEGAAIEFDMKAEVASAARKRKKKAKAKTSKKAVEPPKPARVERGASTSKLEEALRAWRLGEAKRRAIPAFRILTDATLRAIAERRPSTGAELLAVPGIGMKAVENYGAAIYRLVEQAGRAD